MSEDELKILNYQIKTEELVFWIEEIDSILKDSKDLLYMTPMSALSILKTKIMDRASYYQSNSDKLKFKLARTSETKKG